jgi:hypothetical protein
VDLSLYGPSVIRWPLSCERRTPTDCTSSCVVGNYNTISLVKHFLLPLSAAIGMGQNALVSRESNQFISIDRSSGAPPR